MDRLWLSQIPRAHFAAPRYRPGSSTSRGPKSQQSGPATARTMGCCEATEFAHWSEIARLFEPHYRGSGLPDEIRAELDRITAHHSGKAEQALECSALSNASCVTLRCLWERGHWCPARSMRSEGWLRFLGQTSRRDKWICLSG